MYGDVTVKLEESGGVSDVSGIGVQVKIGVASVESDELICIHGGTGAGKIKGLLGQNPLSDACILASEWGAKMIYAKTVPASTPGTIGKVEHTGTGTGSLTVSGKPTNSFKVLVEIMESGKTNEGSFRCSVDGGLYYGDEMTIPLSGAYEIPDTGLTLLFADAETEANDSFVEGDIYAFDTTAPTARNDDILKAMDELLTEKRAFEMIHIVGPTTEALWAALASYADRFFTDRKKPTAIIVETRNKAEEESWKEYLDALKKARKSVSNFELQAVASWGSVLLTDGRKIITNLASLITGLYGEARESQSIGEVRSFPISENRLFTLLPEGVEDYTEDLDAMGYCTIRRYDGREEYFVTSANMLAPEKSDYQYMEDVRVLNRLVKEVRMQAIEELQRELDPEDMKTEIAAITANLQTPMEDAVDDEIISSGEVEITSTPEEILETETTDIQVRFVLHGHLRSINLSFRRARV